MVFLVDVFPLLIVNFLLLLLFRNEEFLFRIITAYRYETVALIMIPTYSFPMISPNHCLQCLVMLSPLFFFLICKLAHAFTQQGWPQRKLICLPSGFPEDHNYATIKLCFKVTWSHHFPDCFSHLSVDKCTIMLHLENLASPILPTSSFQFSGVTVSIASMMVCRRLNIKSPMSNLF